MNKSWKYTILTVFLALVFAFGSMAGMNGILEARERQILTESGKAVVEAPIRAWQTADYREGEEEGAIPEKAEPMLTAEQTEEVLNGWNQRRGVTVHEPVDGQISMEEAIGMAQQWLAEMGLTEKEQERDTGATSVSAVLGVATQEISEGTQLEPYYSLWTVQISGQSASAVLYLNAVTGKVWNAEVTLSEAFPEEMPYEKLKCFVEMSGLLADEADIVKNQEGTKAVLQIDGSRIWAEMEFCPPHQTDYSDSGYGIISFQLAVGQNP